MTRTTRALAVALIAASVAPALTAPASAAPLPAMTASASTAPLIEQVRWRGRGVGIGIGAGIIGGAIIGGALASRPYYYGAPYPYYRSYYAPRYYAAPAYTVDDAVGYCMRRFRSYDPASGTYLGYDGYRHPCP